MAAFPANFFFFFFSWNRDAKTYIKVQILSSLRSAIFPTLLLETFQIAFFQAHQDHY